MPKKYITTPILFALCLTLFVAPTVQIDVFTLDVSYGNEAEANAKCAFTTPLAPTVGTQYYKDYSSKNPFDCWKPQGLCWADICAGAADAQGLQQIFQQAQQMLQKLMSAGGGGGGGGASGGGTSGSGSTLPDYTQEDAINNFYKDFEIKFPDISSNTDNNTASDPLTPGGVNEETDRPYSKPGALPQTYFCANPEAGCQTTTNTTSGNTSGSASGGTPTSGSTNTSASDSNTTSGGTTANADSNTSNSGNTGSTNTSTSGTTQSITFTSPELESFIQGGGQGSAGSGLSTAGGSIQFFEVGKPDRVIYGDDLSELIEQIHTSRSISREEAVRLLASGDLAAEYGVISNLSGLDSQNTLDNNVFNWTQVDNRESKLPNWLLRLYEKRMLILPLPLVHITL